MSKYKTLIFLLRILGYSVISFTLFNLANFINVYSKSEDKQHSGIAIPFVLYGIIVYFGIGASILIIASRIQNRFNSKAVTTKQIKPSKLTTVLIIIISILIGYLFSNKAIHSQDYLEDQDDELMAYNLSSASNQISIYAAKNNKNQLPPSIDTPGVKIWNDDLSKVSYRILDSEKEIYELCGIFKNDTTKFYGNKDLSKPEIAPFFREHKAGKQCYSIKLDRTDE